MRSTTGVAVFKMFLPSTMRRFLSTGAPFFIMAAACVCTRSPNKGSNNTPDANPQISELASAFLIDETTAKQDMEVFALLPHPFGSDRNRAVADLLLKRVGETASFKQEFTVQVPNPAALLNPGGPVATTLEKTGQNIIVTGTVNPAADCIILLGSHYDSKDIEGITYLGANDSGSSSVALIHIISYLKTVTGKLATQCDIGAVWFDGEEALLKNWNDGLRTHPAKIQDNTYGSRYFVSNLTNCNKLDKTLKCLPEQFGGKAVVALVLLDMIGSPKILISREINSSVSLLRAMEAGAAAMDLSANLNPASSSIEDDHIPFRQAGIPAVDIIDFNNLSYWHAAGDDSDKISYKSMELASMLAVYVTLQIALDSKVFAESTE